MCDAHKLTEHHYGDVHNKRAGDGTIFPAFQVKLPVSRELNVGGLVKDHWREKPQHRVKTLPWSWSFPSSEHVQWLSILRDVSVENPKPEGFLE